jgi:hypothetical protein
LGLAQHAPVRVAVAGVQSVRDQHPHDVVATLKRSPVHRRVPVLREG